jgi:hypothetical protein
MDGEVRGGRAVGENLAPGKVSPAAELGFGLKTKTHRLLLVVGRRDSERRCTRAEADLQSDWRELGQLRTLPHLAAENFLAARFDACSRTTEHIAVEVPLLLQLGRSRLGCSCGRGGRAWLALGVELE